MYMYVELNKAFPQCKPITTTVVLLELRISATPRRQFGGASNAFQDIMRLEMHALISQLYKRFSAPIYTYQAMFAVWQTSMFAMCDEHFLTYLVKAS